MCDTATMQLVEGIVEEKLQAGEMFTALDITQEARKRGTTERHHLLKLVVHNCFEQGNMGQDWTRTLISIPGASPQPWLYHRNCDDPNDYLLQHGFPLVRSRSPRRRFPNANGCTPDKRSRVCVPVRWLRAVGFRPGDEIFVVQDPTTQTIFLTRNRRRVAGQRVVATYTIERQGNVRVSQGTLRRAGMAANVFDIGSDGKRVTLRIHNQTAAGQPAPSPN